MRRPRSVPRFRGHARRVVAGAVLVGYLAVLGATTTGHGLRLALHLLSEHHDAGHDDHGHDHDADGHDDHDHGRDVDHARDIDHDHADHDEQGHDGAGHDDDADAPHAHHGRVHTHHEEPPPPAWLSATLDKHVGPAAHRVPAPRLSRRAAVLRPSARPAAVVITVEVRPPRREA